MRARAMIFLSLVGTALVAPGVQASPDPSPRRPAAPSAVCRPLVPPSAANRALAGHVQALLARYADYGFSGSVLMLRGRERIVERAYGKANALAGTPNRIDTLYDVGSLAKTFTAAAILDLEARGKLRLDDPLAKYLPALSPEKRSITLHHLLTHTSGYPLDSGNIGIASTDSNEEFLRKAASGKLAHEPGRTYEYSNLGYGLLAHVIRQVSGESWQSYVRRRVVNRAGLKDTFLYGEPIPKRLTLARGYLGERMDQADLQPLLTHDSRNDFLWGKYTLGSVGVFTNVTDLRRFWCALNGAGLLPREQRARLFTIQAADQGYGWNIQVADGETKRISRGGLRGPYQSLVAYYPPEDALIVYALNRNVASNFWAGFSWQALQRSLRSEAVAMPPPTVRVPASALAPLAGAYRLPSGGSFLVRIDAGQLHVSGEGQDAVDALLLEPAVAPAAADAARRETEALVAALAAGQRSRVQDLGALKPAQLDQLGAKWAGWSSSIGGFERGEILGSTPGAAGYTRTFVRLQGKTGARVVRFLWDGKGALMAWGDDIAYAADLTLWPQGARRFVGYDFAKDKSLTLDFGRNGLTVASAGAVSRATRSAKPK